MGQDIFESTSFKKGYQEELGRLMARKEFEHMEYMSKQREFMVGLQTGRYQPQPDGTILTAY